MCKWALSSKIKTSTMARIMKALIRCAFCQLPSHFNWKQCLLITQNPRFLNSASLRNYFFTLCGAKVRAPRVMFHTSFLTIKARAASQAEKRVVPRPLLFGKFCCSKSPGTSVPGPYFADSTGQRGSLLFMVSSHATSQTRFEQLHDLYVN